MFLQSDGRKKFLSCNRTDGFHFTVSIITEINTRHCDGCTLLGK